jgi:ADP-ribose pyrophosphatase
MKANQPENSNSPVWQGKHIQVHNDNGWEYVQRNRVSGIVCLVAVTPENKLLIVEQYRPPLKAHCIEIPAGLAGDTADYAGEAMETAARRELLEETGYEAQTFKPVFTGAVSAGLSDEVITFFIAQNLKRVGEAQGDGHEQITVHEIDLKQIHDWLGQQHEQGKIIDCKVYTGLEICRRFGLGEF